MSFCTGTTVWNSNMTFDNWHRLDGKIACFGLYTTVLHKTQIKQIMADCNVETGEVLVILILFGILYVHTIFHCINILEMKQFVFKEGGGGGGGLAVKSTDTDDRYILSNLYVDCPHNLSLILFVDFFSFHGCGYSVMDILRCIFFGILRITKWEGGVGELLIGREVYKVKYGVYLMESCLLSSIGISMKFR